MTKNIKRKEMKNKYSPRDNTHFIVCCTLYIYS